MGIMGVLFNPKGRIQANQFWQGVIVLVGLQIVLYLGLAYVSLAFFLAYLLLLYPYACVYAKRLHDSGKTGWIFFAFLIAALIVYVITNLALSGFSSVDEDALNEQLEILTQEEDLAGMLALMKDALQAEALLEFVKIALTNVIVGFFVARMFSDPYANQYGPPVGGEAQQGPGSVSDDDIFS